METESVTPQQQQSPPKVEPGKEKKTTADTKGPSKADKANKNKDSNVIRGRPKSGRIWKTPKERFTTGKTAVRGKKTAQQLAYRDEIKQIRSLSQSIKEERRRENEEKRLRREENKRRRLENERKSEIVQVINNPRKLKRMRKKQLRMIEKRDTTKLNIV